jgi:hypothetical protein
MEIFSFAFSISLPLKYFWNWKRTFCNFHYLQIEWIFFDWIIIVICSLIVSKAKHKKYWQPIIWQSLIGEINWQSISVSWFSEGNKLKGGII